MPSVVFSSSAKEDLIEIWLYTQATWSDEQADLYQKNLHDCCAKIAFGNAHSKPVRGIKGVKVCRCHHHYIFFTEREATIVVIAVLHERMDLLTRLKDRL